MDCRLPLRLTTIAYDFSPPLVLILIAVLAVFLTVGPVWAQVTPETALPSPRSPFSLAELLERADRKALHESPQWLALVHYERHWWRPGLYSRATTEGFLLSERGDRDPRAELHATLTALVDPDANAPGEAGSKNDEPLACRFVARRHWLAKQLDLEGSALPSPDCPRYEQWRAGLGAQGLSLIFPEGFMSNPASVFGHTLLRIDVDRQPGPEEIAGWAIDFTAETGGDGGLVYMARGVFGFYPGRFGARPYYEQLKRYSDWENRDIWEYRLNVSDDELDLLLMHLWELDEVVFPYFFFTKNCSYELLRLLEAGIPDLEASRRFRGPVFPIDTVRAVEEHTGLVDSTRYRASPETKLRAARASLSPRERSLVSDIVAGRADPKDVAANEGIPGEGVHVLDVAYDQLRYQYLSGAVTEEQSRGLARRILIARSRLPSREPGGGPAAPVEPKARPDQGHGSSLLSLGAGWRDDRSYIDLRWRPAFHELMDKAEGHLAEMEIRLLDTRLRVYPESGRVRLQELTFFELASLSPRSHVFAPWAWRAGTGLRTRRVSDEGDLDDALVWETHIGGGLAWEPHAALLGYALADTRLEVGSRLEHNVGLGPGVRLGVYLGPSASLLRGHLFAAVTYFAVGDTTTQVRAGGEMRISTSRNTALHFDVSANRNYSDNWLEAGARWSLHF